MYRSASVELVVGYVFRQVHAAAEGDGFVLRLRHAVLVREFIWTVRGFLLRRLRR